MQSVHKVYCVDWASSRSPVFSRVIETLSAGDLLVASASPKIKALPSDLSQPELGLGEAVIYELRHKLTKVIHGAWAVNFNIGARTFEQQHIRVCSTLSTCVSRRANKLAQLYFCSSISAAAGMSLPTHIDEGLIPELLRVQNMGYPRSKLVAENIVQVAAEKTGIVAKVLRMGQIVGDTVTGR